MLIASTVEHASWRPDFSSSGLHAPKWTRLRCQGLQLSNAFDWVEWDGPLIQVEVCEQCGYEHCASGGYVVVSRLGRHILWTSPRFESIEGYGEEVARVQFAPLRAVREHGAIAIPIPVWDDLSARFRRVPAATALVPATRWDVRQAWLGEAHPGDRASADLEGVLSRGLMAVDQGPREDVAGLVRRLGAWLDAAPDAVVEGELVALEESGANLVTLYFERPDRHWPALALVDQTPAMAFAGKLVLLPPSGSETQAA